MSLQDAFIDEVRDAYDAERQLMKALPKMAKAASSASLKSAFEAHLRETKGQVTLLERAFASLGEKVRGKHCDGIAGIIEEGKSVMEEDFDDATMDACLIAAGQRAEHYEMAAYGSLIAWAKALGHGEAAGLLEKILEQEKGADATLSQIAESGINRRAAEAPPEDEEKSKRRPGTRKRAAGKKASRKKAAKKSGARKASRTKK